MSVRRIELGSEFNAVELPAAVSESHPWPAAAPYFGAGRWALRALVEQQARAGAWRRLWLPAYSCPLLVEALDGVIAVQYYGAGIDDDSTYPPAVEFRDGDVLLRQNLFGLGLPVAPPEWTIPTIEDHTHDPWSDAARGSRANWCFASLRKTLPIADGAVLWSPGGHAIVGPGGVVEKHRELADRKRTAMAMKARYLRGEAVEKPSFLSLYREAEAAIAQAGVSAITPESLHALERMPVARMRQARLENWRELAAALPPDLRNAVLRPRGAGDVPFGLVLRLACEALRDRLRDGLVQAEVYPAVLWPLAGMERRGVPQSAVKESERILMLHTDSRYDGAAMRHCARTLDAELAGSR
jgi:hypothetical protein